MTCANAVAGASGWIDFRSDASYGNPTKKRVPIVRIQGDGTTKTISAATAADSARPTC
jgi:hypothetical protein